MNKRQCSHMAHIADLCREDKQRVATLIQQVIKVSTAPGPPSPPPPRRKI